MKGHEVALLAIAFLAEIAGTVAGFGSSTFFVPAAAFLEDMRVVLAVTGLLHVFGNVAKLWIFGKHVDRGLFLRFVVPTVLATAAGAWLTDKLPLAELDLALGVFLVVLSTTLLLRPALVLPRTRLSIVAASVLSGGLTGLVGTGGAVRGLALTAFRLDKLAFVATSSAIDVLGDAARAAVYLEKGYLDRAHWFYVPLLLAVAYAGARIGRALLGHVSEAGFRRGVLAVTLLMGLVTVFRGLRG